jgi:hypothetical protein
LAGNQKAKARRIRRGRQPMNIRCVRARRGRGRYVEGRRPPSSSRGHRRRPRRARVISTGLNICRRRRCTARMQACLLFVRCVCTLYVPTAVLAACRGARHMHASVAGAVNDSDSILSRARVARAEARHVNATSSLLLLYALCTYSCIG